MFFCKQMPGKSHLIFSQWRQQTCAKNIIQTLDVFGVGKRIGENVDNTPVNYATVQ